MQRINMQKMDGDHAAVDRHSENREDASDHSQSRC